GGRAPARRRAAVRGTHGSFAGGQCLPRGARRDAGGTGHFIRRGVSIWRGDRPRSCVLVDRRPRGRQGQHPGDPEGLWGEPHRPVSPRLRALRVVTEVLVRRRRGGPPLTTRPPAR